MIEIVIRSLYCCLLVIGGLYFGGYVVDLEHRVTDLEDRYENSLVLPLPTPLTDRLEKFSPGFRPGDLSI